jgi:hypothetical protein
MNKNLLIGVGVIAVVGVGAFLYFRKRQTTTEEGGLDLRSATMGAETGTTSTPETPSESEPEVPLDETLASTTNKTKKEARQERRQNRRDCKAEAITKRLKWGSKKRRDFMKDCKAAGGANADFASEESDFAFNGFSSFN